MCSPMIKYDLRTLLDSLSKYPEVQIRFHCTGGTIRSATGDGDVKLLKKGFTAVKIHLGLL